MEKSYRRKFLKMRQVYGQTEQTARSLQTQVEKATEIAERIATENSYLMDLMVDLNAKRTFADPSQVIDIGSPSSSTPPLSPARADSTDAPDGHFHGDEENSDYYKVSTPPHLEGPYIYDTLSPLESSPEPVKGISEQNLGTKSSNPDRPITERPTSRNPVSITISTGSGPNARLKVKNNPKKRPANESIDSETHTKKAKRPSQSGQSDDLAEGAHMEPKLSMSE